MKKKKILFVINRLNVGGVEKSLLGLLNALPSERYDIDLGVIEAEGGFKQFVPPHVRLFEIPSLARNKDILLKRLGALKSTIRQNPFKAFKMLPLYLYSQVKRTLIPFYNGFVSKDELPRYDVAVTYQGPSELLDFYISRCVDAERKYCWIHFDIDQFFVRERSVKITYPSYERIFIVSETAKERFDKRFPDFSDKTEVLLNIIDRESDLRLADEPNVFIPPLDSISVLTVGRICNQKAQDIALKAAVFMKSRGLKFHWYFVGGGDDIDKLERMARGLGLSEDVTFVGPCSNPYPFMKNCGVYVQPSRYEGFCIAIGEAKLFGVPIVATDFVGAREQLHDVANAQIVPEPDPEVIADAVIKAARMGRVEPPKAGIPPQIDRLVDIFG